MTLASKSKGISSGGDVMQPHKLNGQSRDTAKGTLSTSHLQNKDQKEKRNPEKTNKMGFFYGKRLKIKHKCDDLTFLVVNFHSISSNIPAAPAYIVYISQLIHYFMVCAQYRVIFLTETQY
jgi:hypothetical protein